MSKNGGYKIIDFKNVVYYLDEDNTIFYVYKEIVNNKKKAILISGLNVEGKIIDDTFVNIKYIDDSTLYFEIDDFIVKLEYNDEDTSFIYINTSIKRKHIIIDSGGEYYLENETIYEIPRLLQEKIGLYFESRICIFDSSVGGDQQGGILGECSGAHLNDANGGNYILLEASPGLYGSYIIYVTKEVVYFTKQFNK